MARRGGKRVPMFDQEAAVMAFMLGETVESIAERLKVPKVNVYDGIRMLNTWRALEWVRGAQPSPGAPGVPAPMLAVFDPNEKVDIQTVLRKTNAWLDAMTTAINDPANGFTVKENINYGTKVVAQINALVKTFLEYEDFAIRMDALARFERFRQEFVKVLRGLPPDVRGTLLTAMREHNLLVTAAQALPMEKQ